MDKTLKRQIGFKPEKKAAKQQVSSKFIKSENGKLTVPAAMADVLENSPFCAKAATTTDIVKWVNDHPYFKWGKMCRAIGIDAPNFNRTLASDNPKLKPEVIAKIVPIISKYGFK